MRSCTLALWPVRWRRVLLPFACVCAVLPGQAQTLRDPTVAPLEARPPAVAASAVSAALERPSPAINLIVREGRTYVAAGTRLYQQGDTLGSSRIERISETEIWYREAGELRKVPRFAGIERRTLPPDCVIGPVAAVSTGQPSAPPAVTKPPRIARAAAKPIEKTATLQAPCTPVGP